MKKIIYILFAIIIIVLIGAGCGEKKETQSEQQLQASPQEQTQPEIKDYDIQFIAEHVSGRSFKVSGTTNLPDGAIIWIKIYDEDYFKYDEADSDWRLENLTYFGDTVIVKKGKFTKTLTASEIEAPLKSDNYKVEICFNPRAHNQPNSIKKIVGENGEYLGGELAEIQKDGYTTLETSRLISLNY